MLGIRQACAAADRSWAAPAGNQLDVVKYMEAPDREFEETCILYEQGKSGGGTDTGTVSCSTSESVAALLTPRRPELVDAEDQVGAEWREGCGAIGVAKIGAIGPEGSSARHSCGASSAPSVQPEALTPRGFLRSLPASCATPT